MVQHYCHGVTISTHNKGWMCRNGNIMAIMLDLRSTAQRLHLTSAKAQPIEDLLEIYSKSTLIMHFLSLWESTFNSPGILAHLYGQRRNKSKSFHSSTAHIYDDPVTTY